MVGCYLFGLIAYVFVCFVACLGCSLFGLVALFGLWVSGDMMFVPCLGILFG